MHMFMEGSNQLFGRDPLVMLINTLGGTWAMENNGESKCGIKDWRKYNRWTIMLLNDDDVARCGASYRESKWLVGMNYIALV